MLVMLRQCLFHTIVVREAYTPCATNLHCSCVAVVSSPSHFLLFVELPSEILEGHPEPCFLAIVFRSAKLFRNRHIPCFDNLMPSSRTRYSAMIETLNPCQCKLSTRSFVQSLMTISTLPMLTMKLFYIIKINIDCYLYVLLLSVRTSRSHLDIVHACIFLLKLLASNKPLTAK